MFRAVKKTRRPFRTWKARLRMRSEEHTSELQSQSNLVCRLLLEKKKSEVRRAGGSALCPPRLRAGRRLGKRLDAGPRQVHRSAGGRVADQVPGRHHLRLQRDDR